MRCSYFLKCLLAVPLYGTLTSAITVNSTILVLARDAYSAFSATSGLDGYGIPYQTILVPQTGTTLPVLNSTRTSGNYGGFIIMSELSYEYPNGYASALTAAQWQQLYDYQSSFGARMVRLDVYPYGAFGVETAISGQGCCDSGTEQFVSFSNLTAFPTAGLVKGATVTTNSIYHYPAVITDPSTTTEIAQFSPAGAFTNTTTAAVINNFSGRQQMVWFTGFATQWSASSNFLMHAHINWITRGLYAGRRRMYFGTQVDDMHLATTIYQDTRRFRVRTTDLDEHVAWQKRLQARLPAGSSYIIEMAHNGNGNVQWALQKDNGICNPKTYISYSQGPAPPLEFQKVLGTGTNVWPTSPASYSWSNDCVRQDPIGAWFTVAANRDAFLHVSHTFSHENLNNATYSDVNKEMRFNKAWLDRSTISAGNFSKNSLVPPAITGLHNGDAIKAFLDNGISVVTGDNSRPPITNLEKPFWPLITNVANNGYDGLTIIPRWPTAIYFDCDTANCTLSEWINVSGGYGGFSSLIDFTRSTESRHLLGLHHDPFMFHQANMRLGDVPTFTAGDQTGQFSLLQIFTEVVLQEMMRLTTWPVVTLGLAGLGEAFTNRMNRDKCLPYLIYTMTDAKFSTTGTPPKFITGVTVGGALNNKCTTPIPVTVPGSSTLPLGATREQLGSDSPTIWTKLTGRAVTITLTQPIPI
ncbi:hypothetical protein HYFRA_00013093 [Hymenoscyphus fraxineus]|uniref:Extracellular serine-rich protein n=1 Tax=Hymenoscyphus fraxineus TaxID=746836 RepID=A0A9N9L787_9HELO|nr:hypothetical protein HYFRA_00013093 [Hymenoscyphus fraxineus]